MDGDTFGMTSPMARQYPEYAVADEGDVPSSACCKKRPVTWGPLTSLEIVVQTGEAHPSLGRCHI